ncbi:hypothetical protein BOTCAL_0076g00210 [Botryotinia calthae]|uniref:Uncharacterized protein n=1 Tax=Botryotinia calthae TaxID=38488 RepID=A0A4Y8D8K2_9HELO|nr:hypothetical protein BOTCAL_0076g00210 [Botryotinia calthae]
MLRKIKRTFRNNASGKQQFEDGEPLLAGSEQLQSSHQGTHQSNMKAPILPFLFFSGRRNNKDPRSLSPAQETRVPQTPQYTPHSPHHPPRCNQRSSSSSIQSNENGRSSTSTWAESVRSNSASRHTTQNVSRTKRHPREVVKHNGSSGIESRSSYASSRDEPHSSDVRYITVERPSMKK